jgi:hypothetical protein
MLMNAKGAWRYGELEVGNDKKNREKFRIDIPEERARSQ